MRKIISLVTIIGAAFFFLVEAYSLDRPSVSGAPCGGDFDTWKKGVMQDAHQLGVSSKVLRQLANAKVDRRVLQRDRSQAIFSLSFIDFSNRILSAARLQKAQTNMIKYRSYFTEAERAYGVPPATITALWALETDFGAIQGDFNTLNALTTLSYDCRRPNLFRPQLLALLVLIDRGTIDAQTTGAWAGEIGQMQLLPKDYLRLGVDGDHDGKVDLRHSAADAIMTTANLLKTLGWRANQPWLTPVVIASQFTSWQDARSQVKLPVRTWLGRGVRPLNLSEQYYNLPASLVLPMGRNGPSFLAFDNFDVFLAWNKSYVYALTAAYFAARLDGQPAYAHNQPDAGLSTTQMKQLQIKLSKRGHEMGKIDGILGKATRDAVRSEQMRLHLPADAWPTQELLDRL